MPQMKKEMSSFDLRRLTAELQALVGGYLDKVYQEDDELFLRFHLPREGRREVYHRVGRWLALAEPQEKPEALGTFAQALRRALPNPRVEVVAQRGFDRILLLGLKQGGEEYRLMLEMFAKGNVVLTRRDKILHVFRPQRFRDRDLRPGATYAFPPGAADPLAMGADDLRRALLGSKKNLVKALASDFNLGGLYAEEVCLRAGIAKDVMASSLGDMEVGTLHAVLQGLEEEALRGPAGLVLKNGLTVDAIPCALRVYDGLEFRPAGSLSEAILAFVAAQGEEVEEDVVLARLRRRLEAQEATLAQLRVEEEAATASAALLYAQYAQVEALLAAARGSVDRRDKVTVELEGRGLALDASLGVDANAQAFYVARKEAREKATRVEEAIAVTRRELGRRAKGVQLHPRQEVKPTKRFGFEAYRWFISSDGFLCLGGRDARSNDKLVKRHLQDGDRYVHAEIQGAPSVVVKEGSRAPEATLQQACQFSLLHSKAWSAGLASGSAYWVLPEQVSKRAESGEFLKSGSFVIRGKRNYFHDLSVEAAVGEIAHEGARKVMGGPPSAVVGRASRWVLLKPGRGDRANVARGLAEAFGVPVAEIQNVLPPGSLEEASRGGGWQGEVGGQLSKR